MLFAKGERTMKAQFETYVQLAKCCVLREVAKQAFAGELHKNILDISKINIPGREPTMRCCVYKEQAIFAERAKLALGGDDNNPNVIEVIDIACDECPVGGYEITSMCRGCIAHRCKDVCKPGAIITDNKKRTYIDKSKCINCGLCEKACPYNAIHNFKRPCEVACKVNAISMKDTYEAHIDNEKCIACGACVYQCPFGAIMDKSYIVDVIDLILESERKADGKMYAIVAPSIASQFTYVKLGQVVSGIKALGFNHVVEVAAGADLVAAAEAKELAEKGLLANSCCPAFAGYVKIQFPELTHYISHSLSPMAVIAKRIKEKDSDAKVVFIGPCTAKKVEWKQDNVRPYVDCVITFEELFALLESKDINLTSLPEDELNDATYFGRMFAVSGGLVGAVGESLRAQGFNDFEFKPVICNGIEECRKALIKASKNVLEENFIEGMACTGGCIGGAGCLRRSPKNRLEVEKFANEVK